MAKQKQAQQVMQHLFLRAITWALPGPPLSITETVAPASDAAIADLKAAIPEPTTMTSHDSIDSPDKTPTRRNNINAAARISRCYLIFNVPRTSRSASIPKLLARLIRTCVLPEPPLRC